MVGKSEENEGGKTNLYTRQPGTDIDNIEGRVDFGQAAERRWWHRSHC
jgi:hypothetical protein